MRSVERRYREVASESAKQEYEQFMTITPCTECGGRRLKRESLAVTVGGKNISEITDLSVTDLAAFMQGLRLTEQQSLIGKQILKEINARLSFMIDVGLDYLTLSRATGTLSGGEAQRVALARTLIVKPKLILFDEPLSALDAPLRKKLANEIRHWQREIGFTGIMVTHDIEEAKAISDRIILIRSGKKMWEGNANEFSESLMDFSQS